MYYIITLYIYLSVKNYFCFTTWHVNFTDVKGFSFLEKRKLENKLEHLRMRRKHLESKQDTGITVKISNKMINIDEIVTKLTSLIKFWLHVNQLAKFVYIYLIFI